MWEVCFCAVSLGKWRERNDGGSVVSMDRDERIRLGRRVRAAMAEAGMTRDQMREKLAARGIAVDVKTISNNTTGRHPGAPETLLAMADILGMLTGETERNGVSLERQVDEAEKRFHRCRLGVGSERARV